MPLFFFAGASNMSAIPFSLVNTQIISYLILVRCKDCSMNDQIYTIYCFCISMGAWNCHFLFSRSMATIIHTEPLNRFFSSYITFCMTRSMSKWWSILICGLITLHSFHLHSIAIININSSSLDLNLYIIRR